MISQNKYRTFWQRFWAGFIDGLVLMPIAIFDDYWFSSRHGAILLILWAIVSYSSYWLYSVLLHARSGQTLGKRAMHVKVMDVSETAIPSLKQAFLRDIGYIVINVGALIYLIYLVLQHNYITGPEQLSNGLPGRILGWAGSVWFLLEVVTMLTNDKRRALHDVIAGTVVVNTAYTSLDSSSETRVQSAKFAE